MMPPRRLVAHKYNSIMSHIDGAPKDQVQGRLLLDVVVAQSATILELLSGEDQALLVGRDTGSSQSLHDRLLIKSNVPLLILNLGLDIVDSVRGLNLEGNGLAREGLDENLHLVETLRSESMFHVRTDFTTHFGRLCLSNELNGGVVDEAM